MKDLTDNEVLADFVGNRLPAPSKGYEQQWELPMCECYYPSVMHLGFDRRWERIMPVWYKFKELEGGIPERHLQKYYAFLDEIVDSIVNQGPSPAIACKLLANAIRWYKSVKK